MAEREERATPPARATMGKDDQYTGRRAFSPASAAAAAASLWRTFIYIWERERDGLRVYAGVVIASAAMAKRYRRLRGWIGLRGRRCAWVSGFTRDCVFRGGKRVLGYFGAVGVVRLRRLLGVVIKCIYGEVRELAQGQVCVPYKCCIII